MKLQNLTKASLALGLGACLVSTAAADVLLVEGTHVRRYTDGGTFLGTFVAGLNTPLGVTRSEPSGNLFISQYGAGEIHKYADDGADLGAVLTGFPDWQPAGLAWNDGRLYATSIRHKAIASYEPDAGVEDGNSNTPSAQRTLLELPTPPHGVASAAPNRLPGVYFTTSDDQTGEGLLGYWDGVPEHREKTLHSFGKGSQPRGVVAWEGNVLVALLAAGKVVRVNAKGEADDWLKPLNRLSAPQYVGENMPVGLAIHDGKLYVSSYGLRDQGGRKVFSYRLTDKSPQETINPLGSPQYFVIIPPEAEDRTGAARFLSLGGVGGAGHPVLRAKADLKTATLSFLSWDTEGGDRAKLNLLRSGVSLVGRAGTNVVKLAGRGVKNGKDAVVFRLVGAEAEITWTVRIRDGGMRMAFSGNGPGLTNLQGLVLTFPLEMTATATVPLADEFSRDGSFQLPALVYAPDLGAMRVTCAAHPKLAGSWQGSRETRSASLSLNLPVPAPDQETVLDFEPWHLPQPKSVKDVRVWQGARRGWLNLLQVNTHRPEGDFAHGIHYPEYPAGVWANNTVSDPVGSTVFWLADHVLLMPQLAPDVSATSLLRRTVELWMNDGASPEGQVYYVWRGGSPADSNPAILIGAWAYVEASGDIEWFKRNVERLEFISKYMEKRDVDGDGLVESPQTGNRNSHSHGETAWDCISSGHKNAYVNALAYRAWRGMARMQERAGRTEQARHFNDLAARLKKVYRDTFYNQETGWLGWWRSADGELHDVWSDMPTSMAIMYGLVTPTEGRQMLDKYWAALEKTGFKNFELGLPLNIRPIPPSLMLTGFGGKLEDGSDNYGRWLNGGLCLSNTSFWLAANFMVGRGERADMVLNAMLARQRRGVFPNGGAFQNGVVDSPPNGGENFDWEGNAAGYEGHLVYSWTWMQSLLLRDPGTSQRVFGVLQ